MGRKPEIANEEEYKTIKDTIEDVQKKEGESYKDYVVRINRRSNIHPISEKALSRAMRSNTYKEYQNLVKKNNDAKPKKPDDLTLMDIFTMQGTLDKRLSRIEERQVSLDNRMAMIEDRLNHAEVKILAVANEDNLTSWETLHKEIKSNNSKEAYN